MADSNTVQTCKVWNHSRHILILSDEWGVGTRVTPGSYFIVNLKDDESGDIAINSVLINSECL